MKVQVNAVGDACPLPVIKTKRALEEMESGELEVLVDNETAVQNIKRFAQSAGCTSTLEKEGEHFRITIQKTTAANLNSEPKAETGKTVVALSSDTMGSGDDELGKLLMKGFVFALTQLDTLPETILLYNAGAKLSVAGSDSLNDLIALEKAGVKVMTCGTCLNHYEIAQQLRVGEVTNMYSIVEEMRSADRILRP